MQNNAAHHLQESATCHETAASENDSLLWFAELISSHEGNPDNENVAEVKGTAWGGEVLLYASKSREPKRRSVTSQTAMKRSSRQRKDFQRDVLPGLASLSRNEVTEDLQLIEGLITETGGSWQSSLTLRNAGRSGKGRGRKRMGTSAPSTTEVAVSQPQIEEPTFEELQALEERSLTGWGKRTRHPPRQRYNSPVPKR
ncbi:unnamed protein product [Prunus armeniaca]|uniref:Uncharacterized protein n=1 Tax=Prunus armeniaca TaxID=36596 RepID=A0A6J5UFJ1_PRUAR|nr:unnamed protein product [Prunus armeniaca]